MTQTKAYNLKIYCDLKNIEITSTEAQEFLSKKFYEQLTIIKDLRISVKKVEDELEDDEEELGYSILDRIIKK
jgi:hypothetical protein